MSLFPNPLAARDLILVYLACALPLVWLLASSPRRGARLPRAMHLIAALLVAIAVPWSYSAARTRHDLQQLQELMALSQFGEARELASRLASIDSGLRLDTMPIHDVAANLDRAVRQLEADVSHPLHPEADGQQRLQRAQTLAMLGRNEDAVDALNGVNDPALAAGAATLLGTICENQHQWQAAADAFRIAQTAWQVLPASAENKAGRIEATRGLAYAQRKAGHYDEAEATYRELLGLSPTADTYFLLAQFYEDAQNAALAGTHARAAIQLAPDAYEKKGTQLINKLRIQQFGCWLVPPAESPR